MKKRIIITLLIVLFQFLIITSFVCYFYDSSTYLDDNYFESIEDLHNALVDKMDNLKDDSIDFWVHELVSYFEIDDIVVLISTYSSNKSGPSVENSLYIQFAKKKDEMYYLITPIDGNRQSAELMIGEQYSLGGNYWYYAQIKCNREKYSICFLYKDINEKRRIYFDGNITNEIEAINPFTDESFYICYGFSYPDTFWDYVTKNRDKRHVVELK